MTVSGAWRQAGQVVSGMRCAPKHLCWRLRVHTLCVRTRVARRVSRDVSLPGDQMAVEGCTWMPPLVCRRCDTFWMTEDLGASKTLFAWASVATLRRS